MLLVEDEFLIALGIEQTLLGFGCHIVGPVPRLNQAVALAQTESLDGAVLDVNLNGTPVFPVATTLRARGIPFILTTGYEAAALPEAFRDCPRLRKPFSAEELRNMAFRVFGGNEGE